MLEPDEVKISCPVLRGLGAGNSPRLPGDKPQMFNVSEKKIDMDIVKATKKEIRDIVSLNAHVQRIHHDSHPEIFKPASDDQSIYGFFERLIYQESNTILVAYLDSLPVGYVWYAIEEKPDFPMKYSRKQIYIHQIAVREDHRRQEVGKSLFSEIEKQAKEQDITHFELDSWSFNTDAHKFFNKLGFETYNIRMWRRSL